jgi:hypothetical protein
VAPVETPLPLEVLASLPADAMDRASLGLQPSLRLVESAWPVWSVWQANQGDAPGDAVDLERGAEHCACASTGQRVVVYRLAAEDFRILSALAQGATLAEALERSGANADSLARVLGWAFAEGLVVALSPCARA